MTATVGLEPPVQYNDGVSGAVLVDASLEPGRIAHQIMLFSRRGVPVQQLERNFSVVNGGRRWPRHIQRQRRQVIDEHGAAIVHSPVLLGAHFSSSKAIVA